VESKYGRTARKLRPAGLAWPLRPLPRVRFTANGGAADPRTSPPEVGYPRPNADHARHRREIAENSKLPITPSRPTLPAQRPRKVSIFTILLRRASHRQRHPERHARPKFQQGAQFTVLAPSPNYFISRLLAPNALTPPRLPPARSDGGSALAGER